MIKILAIVLTPFYPLIWVGRAVWDTLSWWYEQLEYDLHRWLD